MKVDHELSCKDLPHYGKIVQADDTPGVNHSSPLMLKYADQISSAVRSEVDIIVVILAATGSGKSKVLPRLLQTTLM